MALYPSNAYDNCDARTAQTRLRSDIETCANTRAQESMCAFYNENSKFYEKFEKMKDLILLMNAFNRFCVWPTQDGADALLFTIRYSGLQESIKTDLLENAKAACHCILNGK